MSGTNTTVDSGGVIPESDLVIEATGENIHVKYKLHSEPDSKALQGNQL